MGKKNMNIMYARKGIKLIILENTVLYTHNIEDNEPIDQEIAV